MRGIESANLVIVDPTHAFENSAKFEYHCSKKKRVVVQGGYESSPRWTTTAIIKEQFPALNNEPV